MTRQTRRRRWDRPCPHMSPPHPGTRWGQKLGSATGTERSVWGGPGCRQGTGTRHHRSPLAAAIPQEDLAGQPALLALVTVALAGIDTGALLQEEPWRAPAACPAARHQRRCTHTSTHPPPCAVPTPSLTLLAGALAAAGGTQVPADLGTGWHQALHTVPFLHQHHPRAALCGSRAGLLWGQDAPPCHPGATSVPTAPCPHPITPTSPCPHPYVPIAIPRVSPQGCRLQGWLCRASPAQGWPPFLGGGSVQLRVRLRMPPPHSASQEDHTPQAAQAPGTGGQ